MKKIAVVCTTILLALSIIGCASSPDSSSSAAAPAAKAAPVAAAPAPASAAVVTEAPAEPTIPGAIYSDSFKGATIGNFWKASYKALPGTTDQPFYLASGGTVAIDNGFIVLGNSRFLIGALSKEPTTPTTTPGGVLDLSKPTKLVITFSADGIGEKSLQVYVDNNTTGMANSPLGAASRVFAGPAMNTKANTDLVIDLPAATNTSFIQLRVENGGQAFIKAIKILP